MAKGRPKMERIHITTVDPAIRISRESLKYLRKELKARGLSIRKVGRVTGIGENRALHLFCEGKCYLSVLNTVKEQLELKALIEIDKTLPVHQFYKR